MFSHVMFGVNDLEASRKFYDALLGTLDIGPGVANKQRYFYRSPTGTFAITTPINGEPATHGNGSTIGFVVKSAEQGDAFHAAGLANGGTSCEEPQAFVMARPGTFIWRICVTQTETRFARYTAQLKPLESALQLGNLNAAHIALPAVLHRKLY